MSERAVIYARVSGDDRGKEGRNLDGQLDMGREYAQERAYEVVAELPEDDKGASGYEINLPKLNRVRDMAAAGELDVLIVRELDRLSRNLAKQLVVEEELKRNGVRVEYVLAEYPDTPEGNLQKHVKAAIAEYEREKIKERMARGKRLKAKAGHVLAHGRAPYGYKLTEVDGKQMLAAYESEAAIVREIFHWYAYGDEEHGPLSMRAIAKKLTKMRVPTQFDMTPRYSKKRMGPGEWCISTVAVILSNETYVGTWHYGKDGNPSEKWIPVTVPALVDGDTWEAAQERRRLNREMAKRNTKHQYLMGRRLTCGLCGNKVKGDPKSWRTKAGKRVCLYYRCSAEKEKRAGATCNLSSFRVEDVDQAVWQWISSLLLDPENLALGLQEYKAEKEKATQPLRDRLAILDDQIADHKRQLERLLDLYLGGQFPREVLIERKARLEKTLASLTRERENQEALLADNVITDEQIETIQEFASCIVQGLRQLTFEEKRRIIDLMDVRGVLTIEDGEKVVYVHCVVGEQALDIVSKTSTAPLSPRRFRLFTQRGPMSY
jgi:site-specific DNA recombinase